MAIDREKMKGLIKEVDDFFDVISAELPVGVSSKIKDYILGPAFDEIRRLIDYSRPPKFMMVGRSGHGKSSLINALAKKRVAEISDTQPCNPGEDKCEKENPKKADLN